MEILSRADLSVDFIRNGNTREEMMPMGKLEMDTDLETCLLVKEPFSVPCLPWHLD
jgi:hypothetical protein